MELLPMRKSRYVVAQGRPRAPGQTVIYNWRGIPSPWWRRVRIQAAIENTTVKDLLYRAVSQYLKSNGQAA